MIILKNRTYYQLTGEIDTAKEDARVLQLRFEEMETRKDYLKGEFTRVSILLDECKEQRDHLVMGLAKEIDMTTILKNQFNEASDYIKDLTFKRKEKK